jgi:ribonuclease P protein component
VTTATSVRALRGRAAFAALRADGRRARQGSLWVTRRPGEPGEVRVGYAIGRRTATAVTRNRIRRRLRAVVRSLELAPGDYLIGAGADVATLPYPELRDVLARLTGAEVDR